MKKVMAIVLLAGMMGGMFPASAELVVTMEITSEMPALSGEDIIGKIRLTNNGADEIKLVKNKDDFWFVFSQVYFFLDMPIEEQQKVIPLSSYRNKTRAFVKKETDSIIDKEGDFIILPTGQSCELPFDLFDFNPLEFIHVNRRFSFKAELYVQPDRWIPITITPPLEVAKDAKIKQVTPQALLQTQAEAALVCHVKIGTNEFLYTRGKEKDFRFFDLSPDDQVEQNDNTRITVTRKDGTKTEIATDKIDIFAKQREEKRKAKLATGD